MNIITDGNSKVYFIEDGRCTSKTQTITSLQTARENLPKLRNQANARERYRTYSVNSAFTMLRQLIPTEPQNRKLSKIETLRLATSYIEHLDAILSTGNTKQPCIYIMNKPDLLLIKNHIRNRSNICTFCVATKNT